VQTGLGVSPTPVPPAPAIRLAVQFEGADKLLACLPVVIWAFILGIFMVHTKLLMQLLGHHIFVGVSGILTGGTGATVIEPLVTAAGAVIMGGPRTRFDTFFGVAQLVIAMNGLQDMPPTALVDVMIVWTP